MPDSINIRCFVLFTVIILSLAGLVQEPVRGQALRFPELEGRGRITALVADVRDGRILGGIREADADVSAYYPASLFKLAISYAAIVSGKLDPTQKYMCRGIDTINGIPQSCWLPEGHGTVRYREALAHSCNLYFRRLALSVSEQEILEGAAALQMLPSEISNIHLSDKTILGEACTVTPRLMLQTALVLASRGRIGNRGGRLMQRSFQPLYEGMSECVRIGTAREAWSDHFVLAGKTGTAPDPGYPGRHVGWFIGFAPANHPRYAVAVLVRRGRGSDAAKLGRMMLEKLL